MTGIHALNLNCSLETCGDWHQSALKWDNIQWKESNDSIFGEYGIKLQEGVPGMSGSVFVADHVRALLDLVCDGKFSVAQGGCGMILFAMMSILRKFLVNCIC